jgi:hypothetical protein
VIVVEETMASRHPGRMKRPEPARRTLLAMAPRPSLFLTRDTTRAGGPR